MDRISALRNVEDALAAFEDGSLAARLAEYGDDLPCAPDEAATVVEAYAEGRSSGPRPASWGSRR